MAYYQTKLISHSVLSSKLSELVIVTEWPEIRMNQTVSCCDFFSLWGMEPLEIVGEINSLLMSHTIHHFGDYLCVLS